MMCKRKISFLIDGSENYGIRRTTLSLIKALTATQRDTAIISFNDGRLVSECEAAGAETFVINAETLPTYGRKFPGKLFDFFQIQRKQSQYANKIVDALEQTASTILVVRKGNLVGLAGAAAGIQDCRCYWLMPNVVGSHYPLRINQMTYQYLLWRHHIQPIANSRYTAKTLGNWLVKPEVLHLGVDPAVFDGEGSPMVSRKNRGVPEDSIVVGIFAHLTPAKGQHVVFRAILALPPSNPPVHLLLCGGPIDSDYARSIQKLAEEANATERLHMMGPVESPQDYYPLCDIVANSRIDPEPFGLSVIEAMMMGKPVLAHALGGPAETVIDGKTGWHITSPDTDGFKRGLQRAIDDRHRWDKMSEDARSHALEHFSIHMTVEKFMTIVEAD